MNGGAEWVSGREVAFNEGCAIKEDNLLDKHLNKSSSYIVDLFFKLFFYKAIVYLKLISFYIFCIVFFNIITTKNLTFFY